MEKIEVLRLDDAYIYQENNLILAGLNIKVEKGEYCYLTGKTGEGKSSFLKTLYGEIPLKKGEGNVAGFDLRKLKYKQIPFLRRKLGIVFQDFQLLNDRNVYDNLKFVLEATGWKNKEDINFRIKEVLKKVRMETKGFKFPYQISGGEQQRVAIARALLNDPELILADEPTGNLDPKTSKDIMEIFSEISSLGNTVIIATHDYDSMMKFSGRIIEIENSKIKG